VSDRHDPEVSSIPLDTDDGRQVVIVQQNTGPGNQVGGGEFKNTRGRSVEDAAAQQEELDEEVDEAAADAARSAAMRRADMINGENPDDC
jgi:hypothetical protein